VRIYQWPCWRNWLDGLQCLAGSQIDSFLTGCHVNYQRGFWPVISSCRFHIEVPNCVFQRTVLSCCCLTSVFFWNQSLLWVVRMIATWRSSWYGCGTCGDSRPDMALFVHNWVHDLITVIAEAHCLEVASTACQTRNTWWNIPAPIAIWNPLWLFHAFLCAAKLHSLYQKELSFGYLLTNLSERRERIFLIILLTGSRWSSHIFEGYLILNLISIHRW
jgi:hypothetical protein